MKRIKSIKSLLLVLIITAGVFLAAFNVLSVGLTQRFPRLTADLTRDKIYQLSSTTTQFIEDIEKPIELKVLAREDVFVSPSEYNAQANEIFKDFAKKSGKITLSYVDYTADPTFATGYPDLTMKHGDLLVTSGEKHTLVPTEELFNYTTNPLGALQIASSRAESAVNEAIMKVTSDKTTKGAFTSGHIETEVADFTGLLKTNNFEIETINLVTQGIPPETEMLFVVSPESDFSEGEIEKLDSFLTNGGKYGRSLFYFADASKPALPNLEGFLSEWGILVDTGLVFETDENRVYEYQPFYPIVDYKDSQYSGMLKSDTVPMLMPIAKPLDLLFEFKGEYGVKVLAEYASSSGVRPADAGEDFKPENTQRTGPIPAVVLSTYTAGEKSSNVAVFASTQMLEGQLLLSPALSNSDYIMNLANSLGNREQAVVAQPKVVSGTALGISRGSADTIGIIFTAVIPGLVLLFGVVVWLRRRNK